MYYLTARTRSQRGPGAGLKDTLRTAVAAFKQDVQVWLPQQWQSHPSVVVRMEGNAEERRGMLRGETIEMAER